MSESPMVNSRHVITLYLRPALCRAQWVIEHSGIALSIGVNDTCSVCIVYLQDASQSKMTDESNIGHLSVVMTTQSVVYVTHSIAANVSNTSQSYGIRFYFQCAVVIIGVAGTATNALILYALVASKQHKKHALIFNQNLLDFCSSLLLIMTYAVKLCNIYLIGLGGYWLCMMVLSENLLWCTILAAKANLIFVTIERYLKVVFPVWSTNKLHSWTIYCAIIFAWISGIVTNMTVIFSSTDVINGVCYSYVIWKSRQVQLAFGIWYFLAYYAIELVVFVFCYGHILIFIRRQAKLMAGHNTTGLSTIQTYKIQSSIVKTMILISAFYAISDLPMEVYYLMLNVHAEFTLLDAGYYAAIFASFFYICTNPFIYAIKFDPVKEVLLRLIPCKKSFVVTVEVIAIT